MPVSISKTITDTGGTTRATGESVSHQIEICNIQPAVGVEWVQTDVMGSMVQTTQFVQPFTRPAACGEAPTIRFTGGSRAVFTYDLSPGATGVRLYDLVSSVVNAGVCGDGASGWTFAFHDGPSTASPLVVTHNGPAVTTAGVTVPISSGQVTVEIRRQGSTAYLDTLRLTEAPGNPISVEIEDPIPPGVTRTYSIQAEGMDVPLPESGSGSFDRTVMIPDGACLIIDVVDTVNVPGTYQNVATATEAGQAPQSSSGPEILFEGEPIPMADISITKEFGPNDSGALVRAPGETVETIVTITNNEPFPGVRWENTDILGIMTPISGTVEGVASDSCGDGASIHFSAGSVASFTYTPANPNTFLFLYDLISHTPDCVDNIGSFDFSVRDGDASGAQLVGPNGNSVGGGTNPGVGIPLASTGTYYFEIHCAFEAYLHQLAVKEVVAGADIDVADAIPATPAGITRQYFVTWRGGLPGGSFPDSGNGTFDRTITDLPGGASVTFRVVDTVPNTGVYQNSATASGADVNGGPLTAMSAEVLFQEAATEEITMDCASDIGQNVFSINGNAFTVPGSPVQPGHFVRFAASLTPGGPYTLLSELPNDEGNGLDGQAFDGMIDGLESGTTYYVVAQIIDGSDNVLFQTPECEVTTDAASAPVLTEYSFIMDNGQYLAHVDTLPKCGYSFSIDMVIDGLQPAEGINISLPLPSGSAIIDRQWEITQADGVTGITVGQSGTGDINLTFDKNAVDAAIVRIHVTGCIEGGTPVGQITPTVTLTLPPEVENPNGLPLALSENVYVFDSACLPAENITGNSADLSGTVDGDVNAVNAYGDVRWWVSTDGGATKTYTDAANLVNPTSVSGLTPDTEYTYGYEILPSAANPDNVTHVYDSPSCGTFQTLADVVPFLQCEPATNVTQDTATLNASGGNLPVGAEITICWGISGGPFVNCLPAGNATGAENETFSADATGLSANTSYGYVIQQDGEVLATCDPSFTTQDVEASAQCGPATNVTGNSATINGTVTAPDGQTSQLQWSTSPTGPWNDTATVPGNGEQQTIQADISNLTESTTYYYRAVAGDAISSTCSFTTTGDSQGGVNMTCTPGCAPNEPQGLPVFADCGMGVCDTGDTPAPPADVNVVNNVNLARGTNCDAPLFVNVCNPAVAPVQIIPDSEQVACDPNGNPVYFVPTFDENGNIESHRFILIDLATSTVTDPYAGPMQSCVQEQAPQQFFVEGTEEGCADGVPWSRYRTGIWVAELNQWIVTYTYADSAGNRQPNAPAGFTLGACADPLQNLAVVSNEIGCAEGVQYTRRTTDIVDRNTGAVQSSVVVYVDEAGVVSPTMPDGFALGSCITQVRDYSYAIEAVDGITRQLANVEPNGDQLVSFSVRHRSGTVIVSGGSDETGAILPNITLDPGEVIEFDAGDDPYGWIQYSFLVDANDGSARLTYQYRRI